MNREQDCPKCGKIMMWKYMDKPRCEHCPISADNPPIPGDVYEHNNGNRYKIVMLTNLRTERPKQYPVTAVYQNVTNGTVWSRPVNDWARSFTLLRGI